MKVRELIALLQEEDPNDEVVAWDSEDEEVAPVTGLTSGGEDNRVELSTTPLISSFRK